MKSIALLLQGGGALGAYELDVLHHMNETQLLPPRLVAGISIGAVNAAVLVGSRSINPLPSLETLWKKLNALPDDDHTRFVIVNLFPLRGTVPQNLTQVLDRMLDIIFSNKVLGNLDRLADYTALAELGKTLNKGLPAMCDTSAQRLQRCCEAAHVRATLAHPGRTGKARSTKRHGATLEFSAQTIASRINGGYRDAMRVLGH